MHILFLFWLYTASPIYQFGGIEKDMQIKAIGVGVGGVVSAGINFNWESDLSFSGLIFAFWNKVMSVLFTLAGIQEDRPGIKPKKVLLPTMK